MDNNGIEYLKNELGYKDVECLDLLDTEESKIFKQQWDFILVPEVLEHQDNSVLFLSGIYNKFDGKAEKIVITVPNAFSKANYENAHKYYESLNSDHRYWFTPYTLVKILYLSGFKLELMKFSRNGIIKPLTIIKNRFYSRHPLLRNNIIAIAKW